MDADDSPPDMCVICARLALLSSWAAGRLFLVLERPRSGFCWGESLPSTPLASPGLVGGEEHYLPLATRQLEPAGMLQYSPAEGLVWHLCGMAERRRHWPGLWRLTWIWQPRKPDLWASLGGEGWAGAAGAVAGLGNPSQHLVTCIPLGSQAGGTAAPFPQLLASCQCPAGKAPLEVHWGG